MKAQIIVTAKRNRKPFITEGKKYELIEEVNAGYKVVNDLSKISVEYRNDFYHDTYTHQYGFEFKGGIMDGVLTPTFGYVKDEEQIFFGCIIFCFCFAIGYNFKKKLI